MRVEIFILFLQKYSLGETEKTVKRNGGGWSL